MYLCIHWVCWLYSDHICYFTEKSLCNAIYTYIWYVMTQTRVSVTTFLQIFLLLGFKSKGGEDWPQCNQNVSKHDQIWLSLKYEYASRRDSPSVLTLYMLIGINTNIFDVFLFIFLYFYSYVVHNFGIYLIGVICVVPFCLMPCRTHYMYL